VQMAPVDGGPAQMFGDEAGFDELHQPLQPPQMLAIERIRRAERKPDAVQADGIELPRLFQITQRRTAGAEVILAVDFEPADIRPAFDHVAIMGRAQPDPGSRRDRSCDSSGCGCRQRRYFLAACSEPPTIFSQVPFGTEIHALLSPSFFDVPAQELLAV